MTLDRIIAGRTTLIYWIKTECPVCQMAMPYLERMSSKLAEGGPSDGQLVVLTQNDPAELDRFRQNYGCRTVSILCEPEPYPSADSYGLTHVPTWFLVGPDSKILDSGMSFAPSELTACYREFGGTGRLFSDAEESEMPDRRPG